MDWWIGGLANCCIGVLGEIVMGALLFVCVEVLVMLCVCASGVML